MMSIKNGNASADIQLVRRRGILRDNLSTGYSQKYVRENYHNHKDREKVIQTSTDEHQFQELLACPFTVEGDVFVAGEG